MDERRANDERWMDVALRLGRRGLGRTWPNPAVGCVIVAGDAANGRLVGHGWTQPGGRPHAETVALAQAGAAARGATAYVTLEPCAHHGRTPPCSEALVDAGVARVVSATADPDPRVDGAGHARLVAAGVAVTTGIRRAEAEHDQAGFFSRVVAGRPLVALKVAQSLDGRIATSTGASQWITGPTARARGHLLRADHDAIMVGSGTALADDPALTCRIPGLIDRSPVRIVVDSAGRLPPISALARTAAEVPVWLLTTTRARTGPLQAQGVEPLIVSANGDGHVDLVAALSLLAERGLTRLLVEGGAGLAAALLAADVVDRLHLFTAGLALGGDGHPAIGRLGVDSLASAPRFRHMTEHACGDDRLQLWTRIREAACSPASSPTEDAS